MRIPPCWKCSGRSLARTASHRRCKAHGNRRRHHPVNAGACLRLGKVDRCGAGASGLGPTTWLSRYCCVFIPRQEYEAIKSSLRGDRIMTSAVRKLRKQRRAVDAFQSSVADPGAAKVSQCCDPIHPHRCCSYAILSSHPRLFACGSTFTSGRCSRSASRWLKPSKKRTPARSTAWISYANEAWSLVPR